MPRSLPPEPLESDFDADIRRLRDAIVAEETAEAMAAFHLRLRAHGVQDLAVLRVLELVPRQSFVPHRFVDLAARDLALPIGCGQTLDEPWLVARMIEALRVERGQTVLQIGAGTGYATAILSHLATQVVALERYQSLATSAQARLTTLGIANARIFWGDGLAMPPDAGMFDRILVHGVLAELPACLTSSLAPHGIMVAARPAGEGQALTRIRREGEGFSETLICPCRQQPILPGLATAL